MKRFTRLLSCFLAAAMIITGSTAVVSADSVVNPSCREGELSEGAGKIISGIFNGYTEETDDPSRFEVNTQNGMHFPEFVWVDGTLYAFYIRWAEKCGIGMAKSTDGINFEDYGMVIYPSDDPASFDYQMASFAGAWYEDGVFYVAYESEPNGGNANIALATSTDGINFEKKGLILVHNQDWDWTNYNVGTPDLYKVGDTWYMTFHGYGRAKKDCQIGVAYGTDLFNLTVVDHPVVPTSDDPTAPDCGTCGRRDVVYYDGWYYMAYECYTDGGAINRNLGDNLGVPGKYYYDFSGSNWGHCFARSSDMINWEKAPAQLHESYVGNYCYDGPAWLIMGDDVYLYYRNASVRTCAFKLTGSYVKTVDEATGITVMTTEGQKLSAEETEKGWVHYRVIPQLEENQKCIIATIGLTENEESINPLKAVDVTIPMPEGIDYSEAKLMRVGDDSRYTLAETEYTFENGVFSLNTDTLGRFAIIWSEKLPEYVLGDVNNDGKISSADALLALKSSVNSLTLTEIEQKSADVDASQTVTSDDALLILQHAVGIIEAFPAETAE